MAVVKAVFLLILGIAAAIHPVSFITENYIDLIVLIAMSLMVLIFSRTGWRIRRGEGLTMSAVYVGYMVYICMR